jgi:hypothetical protein
MKSLVEQFPQQHIPWDAIIGHLMTTEFIVTQSLYHDPKEFEEHTSGDRVCASVKPGFRFTPDNITIRPGGLEMAHDSLDFFVEVFVPGEWWHFDGHDSSTLKVFSTRPDGVEAQGADICISSEELTDRCDEAPPHH